jgi:hypothetical protein
MLQAVHILLWLFTVSIQSIHAQSCTIGGITRQNVEKTLGIALLIGNSRYQSGTLNYPVKDANDIANVLSAIGFSVFPFRDLETKENFDDVTFDLKNCLEKSRDFVALFYFSGYGIYIENDRDNFLLPIFDMRIRDRASIRRRGFNGGFNVGILLDRLRESNNKLNIVILDACRQYPKNNLKSLGDMLVDTKELYAKFIIVYPAEHGKTVIPPKRGERNSLYVKYLIEELKFASSDTNPKAQEARVTFDEVKNRVQRESEDEQTPINESTSRNLQNRFCWKKPCSSAFTTNSNERGQKKPIEKIPETPRRITTPNGGIKSYRIRTPSRPILH